MQPEPHRDRPGKSGRSRDARIAAACFRAGCHAAHPRRLLPPLVRPDHEGVRIAGQLWRPDRGRLLIVGAGKASAAMARVMLRCLRPLADVDRRVQGQINVPDREFQSLPPLDVIPCRAAGENLPTSRAVEATLRIVEMVRGLSADDLCVCLWSGGGSALLTLPAPPVTLEEKRALIRWLDRSGADIVERNRIRRELSLVKGGRLASFAPGTPVVSLILSDVRGDPPELVASGPTVPASPDPAGALELLERLAAVAGKEGIPGSVINSLRVAAGGQRIGMPDQGDAAHTAPRVHVVVGNLGSAVAGAARRARWLGWDPAVRVQEDVPETVDQTANRLAAWLVDRNPPVAMLIDGGEPVICIDGPAGLGGRNSHLALEAALRIASASGFAGSATVLSAGTDGEDGNTDLAGAVYDARLFTGHRTLAREARSKLLSFNSAAFAVSSNAAIRSGPTGTNVGDLRIAIRRL